MSRDSRRLCPNWHDESDESQNMHDEYSSLPLMQIFCTNNIGNEGQTNNAQVDNGCMPIWCVVLCIINGDYGLDNDPNFKEATRIASLQGQCGNPPKSLSVSLTFALFIKLKMH